MDGGHLRFDRPAVPEMNADGGGLSFSQPGMCCGIFLLVKATRQLQGTSTAKVPTGPARRPSRHPRVAGRTACSRNRRAGEKLPVPRATMDRPLQTIVGPETAAFWLDTTDGRPTYQDHRRCGAGGVLLTAALPGRPERRFRLRESGGRAVYALTMLRGKPEDPTISARTRTAIRQSAFPTSRRMKCWDSRDG